MLIASDDFISKINSDSRTFRARFVAGESTIPCDITRIAVYKGAGDVVVPGSMYIPYFEAELANCDVTLNHKDITLQLGLVMDVGDEYLSMGIFTVTTEEDSHGYKKVKAVGQLGSKANGLITIPANTLVSEAITKIAAEIKCPVTLKGLTASGVIASELKTTNREALIEIAALIGGFVTEDNAGGIVIAKYGSGDILNVDGDRMIEPPEVETGNYSVTGLKVIVSEEGVDEEGEPIPGVSFEYGTPNISYKTGNMTQSLFDTVVSNIVGYTFTPAKVYLALGDPRLEPWDSVYVTDPNGRSYTVPCLQLEFRYDGGLQTFIDADIATDEESETAMRGSISRAIDQMAAELITAREAILNRAKVTDLDAQTATIEKAIIGSGSANDFTAARLSFTEAIGGSFTADQIRALNAAFDTAAAGTITADNIKSSVATFRQALAGLLTADQINAGSAIFESSIVNQLYVERLDANYAHVSNGVIDNAKIGYADVNDLNAHYAGIDLANVNNAWIENGVIKDAAIGDAQIIGVSANKLTAGTIDAGTIRVINLEAKNLKIDSADGYVYVGSQRIPTKEYIDSLSTKIQDQIDGAIDTFTGTDIPTLQNYPAVNWGANEYESHVGDIYYIANENSDQNGYSYRFTKTTGHLKMPDNPHIKMPDGKHLAMPLYIWTLIKDSDVTKALQDIIGIQGDVSGLKTFESETASWRTDTDAELSSVKGRVTTVETNLGNKVDQSQFSEVKSTVDENSATITTLSETVSKKADGSTVTDLTNTVNKVKQTADTNETAIKTLTKTVEDNEEDIELKYTKLYQTDESIKTEVGKKVGTDEVISRINQSAEAIKIEASKVNIVGVINAINDETVTTIDGGRIRTGSITIGSFDESLQESIAAADQLTLDVEYTWGINAVTLNAKVYKGGIDIHEEFPPYLFAWKQDCETGTESLGEGYTITVARAKLNYAGVVILDFLIGGEFILTLPTNGRLIMPDNKYLIFNIGKEYAA